MSRPRILITVLNWGIGHASRTIPIIYGALDSGWNVDIASAGEALAWLKTNLKNDSRIAFFEKPGRVITYSRHSTMLKIAAQTPGFLRSISEERVWAQLHVKSRGIQRIFSDNCYGVASPSVPSILMTHQVKLPLPAIFLQAGTFILKRLTNQFTEVWVPDNAPGLYSLSSNAASKSTLSNIKYVGVLSRLSPSIGFSSSDNYPAIVGMVSGPEPHRKLMEDALRSWMKTKKEPGLIIAGRPGGGTRIDGDVTTLYDPTDLQISQAICGAKILICRSGYSTLLDLVALKKRAILIPTPGQAEQEGLAKIWSEKFNFATCSQNDLVNHKIPVISGEIPDLLQNQIAIDELATWLKN